jgi:hypothetical protein
MIPRAVPDDASLITPEIVSSEAGPLYRTRSDAQQTGRHDSETQRDSVHYVRNQTLGSAIIAVQTYFLRNRIGARQLNSPVRQVAWAAESSRSTPKRIASPEVGTWDSIAAPPASREF